MKLMQKKDINNQICVSVVEPKLPPEVNGVWMVCFGGPVPDLQPKGGQKSQGYVGYMIKGHQTKWGVSKNRGTPKWMVYNGNPIKMDDLGVPLFSETSKCSFCHFQSRSVSPLPGWCRAVEPPSLNVAKLTTKHSPVAWKPPQLIRDKNGRELVVFHHSWPNYDIPPT